MPVRYCLVVWVVGAALGLGAPPFADAATDPARPDVPELIAASKDAFDHRQYVRADSLAAVACSRLSERRGADPLEHATALVALARARAARRSLADSVAVRSALQALELLAPGAKERDMVLADAHDVLSLILDEQNRADLALGHAHRALALRRACFGDVHEEVAESLYRLGTAQMSLGQVDSALVTMRTGLDLRLRLGIPRDRRIGDFHGELASLLESQGDLDGARAELEATIGEYAARLGPGHPAMCQGLQRASIFEFHNGDLARAAELSQRAVTIAEAVPGYNPVNLALLRGNLVILLSELGDYPRARRVAAQVVPVYTEHLGLRHRQTLWAEVALATTESALGDTASAAARLRSVCLRFETGEPLTSTGALTQARAGLAEILEERDPRAALALAESAETAERARPDLNWTTVIGLQVHQLRLHSKLGDLQAVARLDASIEQEFEAHGLRGSVAEAEALAERSLAASRAGRADDAVRLARAGAALSRERLVRDLRALPDREGLMLAGQRSVPLDALLGQVASGAGDAAAAWDELIRWRGLVGAEVARRRPPAGAVRDTAVLRAHDAWTAAARRLAQFEVRAAGEPDAETAVRRADLRARADDAERRWAAVAPRTVAGAGPPDIGLADLRAAIRPGTAIVSFATVRARDGRPERLVAFVLAAGGKVQFRDLGPSARIDACLGRWRALAGRSPQGHPDAERDCRVEGRQLRALTWDVVAPLLGKASNVLVVAEGPLHRLPWAALPAGDDGYLVERGPTIHVLEAERDLLRALEPETGAGLLAVGGVDFTSGPEAMPGNGSLLVASTRAMLPECSSAEALTFAALPGTEREIEAIAREQGVDVQLLRGAAADEAAFKRLAPGRRIIHLATHAVALDDLCADGQPGVRGVGGVAMIEGTPPGPGAEEAPSSPWLGRRVVLALAGANGAAGHDDENEGLLTAEEVSTLDLQGTGWVVLSACGSGVGDTWNREGVLGLTRAFRLAGARAVIASQWSVDDASTCEWMSALHRARVRGATKAGDAMGEASREILKARRADGRGTHPFHWAAFTATGD